MNLNRIVMYKSLLYHLDSSSVQVGHAQAALSNWVTLLKKKTKEQVGKREERGKDTFYSLAEE